MSSGPAFCAVAVMAKAPRVGDVKTRLVPPLQAEEAAALSGAFLADAAENILAAAAHALFPHHDAPARLLRSCGVHLTRSD